jgi:alanyl-tRNA synthetase
MDAKTIRSQFTNFFAAKGHAIVASAPIVVKNDPTLMFTNAGMNQFKDFFLGNKNSEHARIANTQKCLRVSGKHNDLEEVGIDTYHHTMFEMLGNWSFGDYFKKDAIDWAWELLTEVYKLPKDRLYVTVFGGDKSDNLPYDQEAADLWKQHIPVERILSGSKKDNFWEMGDTGPCGPCSEIHIDLRSDAEIAVAPGKDLVNNDHPQVVEIWNLVFMEFNRMSDGKLKQLPDKHVDTGMGFERLAMAIQGKQSNYDTDVFQPLIQFIAQEAKVSYGAYEKLDIAIRVIADHIRAIAFTIADGQLPSNNGAGYVIRRILRRAVRYGYTHLEFQEPFLYRLLPILVKQFGEVFPEIVAQEDFISNVIREEENTFLKTLDKGLKLLDEVIEEKEMIDGEDIFKLYDTFGFPKDLSLLILREKEKEDKLSISWESEFETELTKQKNRSRADATKEMGDWKIVSDGEDVNFVGYEHLESKAKVLRYREVSAKGKKQYQLVLDTTPFYAESGGQVGDTGTLQIGSATVKVIDTKKENDLIVHFVDKLPSNLEGEVLAQVDADKRFYTENNHSATHLLHAALRDVLGHHVQQRGSLVNEKILRFDFSHFAKMTDEEIQKVEKIVNEKIRQNVVLNEQRNVPIEKAKELGAMALFGEKYGNYVRVITFDPAFSVELCGGTHVKSTGQIGLFKITSESSVAAGVRRIEAISSVVAENYFNEQIQLLEEVKALLKNPKDLVKSIESLLAERSQMQKTLEELQSGQTGAIKKELLGKIVMKGHLSTIVQQVSLPNADALKKICFELRNEVKDLFLVLAVEIDGKPQIAVMLDDHLVSSHHLNASQLVREWAPAINGGGGGQPFFATAGGKEPNGLPEVVRLAEEFVNTKLK